ncbi:hypothetical protein FRC08_006439 [Ceratobasidium sp. 394]|nr:hypothetical protein FRC08_006439 [Ceratobasidium sp. 394]
MLSCIPYSQPTHNSSRLRLDLVLLPVTFESTELQVVLPCLCSFTLTWRRTLPWTLGVMKMVVGLRVETLRVSCTTRVHDGAVSELAKQIANRKAGSLTPPQPLYPALRSLDISGIRHPGGDYITGFEELFSALPTVTFLSAPAGALEILGNFPLLLPQLERIRVAGEAPLELGYTLSERARGGFPVKVLEATEKDLGSAIPEWPESLALVMLPFRLTICYESHDELDDNSWEIDWGGGNGNEDDQDDGNDSGDDDDQDDSEYQDDDKDSDSSGSSD